MKAGILTFHWATNYGAVLQAYALQTYLSRRGHDCRIIDYVPYTHKKSLFRCCFTRLPARIPNNVLDYLKERRIDRFRKLHLRLTQKYSSIVELQQAPPEYDVYICGSDQIWNPSFTAWGEKKTTLSYFLDFGGEQKMRLAYAASFGCTSYPPHLVNIIKPALLRFKAISVRENSALTILDHMGIDNAQLMPDPTMLLQRRDYESMLTKSEKEAANYIFIYALHREQKTIQDIRRYFDAQKDQNIKYVGFNSCSLLDIEEWLSAIAGSKGVVTNSFHGVVFSILFKKPFVAVSVEGQNSGMNDRMNTLLGNLGLNERLVSACNGNQIIELLWSPIDWPTVATRTDAIREDATRFFDKHFSR